MTKEKNLCIAVDKFTRDKAKDLSYQCRTTMKNVLRDAINNYELHLEKTLEHIAQEPRKITD